MVAGVAVLGLLLLQAANPVEDGLKALDGENYAAAITAFESALESSPDNYGILFNLAFAYSMTGRTSDAIAGYEKVLELKPRLYQAELNLGMILLDQGKGEEAVPHLRSAAEQKAGEYRAHFYLAEALYDAGDDAAAERHYRTASEIDPKSGLARIGLGRSLSNQGRLEEAEAHYRRAVELNPEYRDLLVEYATRLEEKGSSEKAIELYREFPENPAVRERLGHLLFQAGKTEEALPHLEFAVRRSPTVANRFALATTYLRLKQPEKAQPLLQLALQEAPDNYDLRLMHARIVRDQRNFAVAAQEFFEAVKLKPDSQEAWSELATSLVMLEDYPKALAALDRVEKMGEAPAGIHFIRAIILDKARLYEPALASYEKFLAASNGSRPDEEFKSRQRIIVIKKELSRR